MTILRKPSFSFQRRIRRLAVGMTVALGSLLFHDHAEAAVYQCKGKDGVMVLTDRPEGLRGCVQIHTLAPSPSHSPSPTPEIRAPSLDPDQRPPVILPAPTAPPLPPRGTFSYTVPPKADTEKPPVPTVSDAQRCSPSLNPLNPLTGGSCPPTAAEPPVEPNKP
jgi:uncharacterized protein DUF4124